MSVSIKAKSWLLYLLELILKVYYKNAKLESSATCVVYFNFNVLFDVEVFQMAVRWFTSQINALKLKAWNLSSLSFFSIFLLLPHNSSLTWLSANASSNWRNFADSISQILPFTCFFYLISYSKVSSKNSVLHSISFYNFMQY